MLINLTEEIKNVVREAILANNIQSGLLTLPVLLQKLDEQHLVLVTMVKGKLKQHLGSATRIHMTASRQSISNNIFEGSV